MKWENYLNIGTAFTILHLKGFNEVVSILIRQRNALLPAQLSVDDRKKREALQCLWPSLYLVAAGCARNY